ncbi:unnamed protein product, partial [Ectocarpus fasciculatus]
DGGNRAPQGSGRMESTREVMASSPSHQQRRSKTLMLSTIEHRDAQEKPRLARTAAAASTAVGQKYGVQEREGPTPSSGTLPPSFTKPFQSHHHHHRHQPHHAPPLFNTSRPRATLLTSATVSEAAALQTLQAANSLATLGGSGSSLLSPHNNALQPNTFSPLRRSNGLPRKRPRTSSHPYDRHNIDFINEIPDFRLGSPAPAGVSPIRAGKGNGNTIGDGGSLWGLSGVPPTGVIDPSTSAEPLETEW